MVESLLLLNAQFANQRVGTVAIRNGVVVESQSGAYEASSTRVGSTHIGSQLAGSRDFDLVIDLQGRAIAPAFHDDHIHTMAFARSLSSVDLSPQALRQGGGLHAVLQRARQQMGPQWIRGVNYDVEESGVLTRQRFRELGVEGPIRVQDRTGILWMLDDAAWSELEVSSDELPAGAVVEDGEPTGVLQREDVWLRERLLQVSAKRHGADNYFNNDLSLDCEPLRQLLPSLGLVSLTDAGANNTNTEMVLLQQAGLPCDVIAMSRDADTLAPPGIELGAVKILLDDHDLPDIDFLHARVQEAHRVGRHVAIHAVTPTQIAVAVNSGIGKGDRIEHGSHIPDGLLEAVVATKSDVIMQPGLLWNRGDRYREQLSVSEHDELQRVNSLMAHGVSVRFSSDAPYGPIDPLIGIRAAVQRQTEGGFTLGAQEAIQLPQAVAAYSACPIDLPIGGPASLLIMTGSWFDVLNGHARVGITIHRGNVTYGNLNRFE